MRKLIYGVGVNDGVKVRSENTSYITKTAYDRWRGMLRRCYDSTCKSYKTYGYVGVYVCDEWLIFSNYLKWFSDNYIEGYAVDKDIKCKELGLEIPYYSPSTCLFIPYIENSKEAIDRRDNTYMKGSSNYGANDIYHYEENKVTRHNFKVSCKCMGWNFDDFLEIYSGERRRSEKYFFYVHKDSDNYDKYYIKYNLLKIRETSDRVNKYLELPTQRVHFKRYCKTINVDFSDFIECLVSRNSNGNGIYVYIYCPLQYKGNES